MSFRRVRRHRRKCWVSVASGGGCVAQSSFRIQSEQYGRWRWRKAQLGVSWGNGGCARRPSAVSGDTNNRRGINNSTSAPVPYSIPWMRNLCGKEDVRTYRRIGDRNVKTLLYSVACERNIWERKSGTMVEFCRYKASDPAMVSSNTTNTWWHLIKLRSTVEPTKYSIHTEDAMTRLILTYRPTF